MNPAAGLDVGTEDLEYNYDFSDNEFYFLKNQILKFIYI